MKWAWLLCGAGFALGADEGWELRDIDSVEAWETRRAKVVASFEAVAGALPDRSGLGAVEVEVHATEARDGYARRSVSFDSGSGDRVTAFVYVPDGAGEEPRAGVVALHPTHAIGKRVVDGESERPNRAYGRELAELGFVVIAPDYVGFGERGGYEFGDDGFGSGTMKGIWDHLRCVDVLVAMDEVDGARLGVIGHSLGGHNAIFLGVFDPRVKAVVSSCGWTPFRDYYGGALAGWASDVYLPRIRSEFELDPERVPFDFYGLVGALAPRWFYSSSPLADGNFDYRGVKKVEAAVAPVYALHGVRERLRVDYPDCGHDFPPAVRREAYAFLGRALEKSVEEAAEP